MFEFEKWKQYDIRREKDSAEMHELLFPKPSDRAYAIAMREILAKLERIITEEEPPPPKERTPAEMLALLFPGRRIQAPVELVSLFVERRRRAR